MNYMDTTLTSLGEYYNDESFIDSTDFKKFLMSEESSTVNIEFELINKIVDDSTQSIFKEKSFTNILGLY